MVRTGYTVSHVDDVDVVRMAEIEEVHEKFDPLGVQIIDETALGTEEMKIKLWHVPPGETMGTHGHPTQEEFYYILEGRFAITIGPPGQTETYRGRPGTVFAASPDIARGYENNGEEEGRVLVVAAPNVSESGIPEDELA